jgi:hypothetical protein
MEKDKKIIFALVAIILIGVVVWLYSNFQEGQQTKFTTINQTAYQNGYQQGQIDLIASITRTGVIPYLEESNGNLTVKTVSINDLCGARQ